MSYVGTAIQKVEINGGGIAGTPAGTVQSVQGFGYSEGVDIIRPANTTAYTAGDVIGIADAVTPANAGSAILNFANVGPAGGHIFITSAWLRIDANAVPSGMSGFRLHLYSSAPDAILDNAAWDLSSSGDRTKYRGYIDFPTPTDLGSTLFAQADGINKQVPLAGGSTALYGVLQSIGGFTPAQNSTPYTLRLRSVAA